MMYCSNKNGINIDTAELFVKLEIEEMVETKFKPGGPVAMYESAESGISPLMVIPITTQEIEEEIMREEAVDKSKGTRNKTETMNMKKADPRRPPRNWYELKDMISTFAVLLWLLFGDVCPLYD